MVKFALLQILLLNYLLAIYVTRMRGDLFIFHSFLCKFNFIYYVLYSTSSWVPPAWSSATSRSKSSGQLIHPQASGSHTGDGDRRRARSARDGHLSKRSGSAIRSAARSRVWRARIRVAFHAMRLGWLQAATSLKRMLRLTACPAVDRAKYGRLICTATSLSNFYSASA